jgi:hypothetical protein
MSDRKEKEKTAINNLRVLLNTPAGYHFFLFLLEEYDVLSGIPAGLSPELLTEEVARQRAGSFILGYITKANPLVLGHLMGALAKEKQDEYISKNPHIEDESDKPEWER